MQLKNNIEKQQSVKLRVHFGKNVELQLSVQHNDKSTEYKHKFITSFIIYLSKRAHQEASSVLRKYFHVMILNCS